MLATLVPVALGLLATVSGAPLAERSASLQSCLNAAKLSPVTSSSSAYQGDIGELLLTGRTRESCS